MSTVHKNASSKQVIIALNYFHHLSKLPSKIGLLQEKHDTKDIIDKAMMSLHVWYRN